MTLTNRLTVSVFKMFIVTVVENFALNKRMHGTYLP